MSTQSDLDNITTIRTSIEKQQNKVQERLDERVEDGSKATETDTDRTEKGSASAVIDGKAVDAPEGDGRTKSSATPEKPIIE
ncbi:hypothetical protein QFC20_004205 [Naganishia adeliensis]|uniref:Uncharacterized protein n=1 Tax=Naganishia adeliensis TaxID=92952 RepID=A0ACC2W431_9TREE|nr:hypothetical protein QFC20_004205 [Naganishia adeliensis]